VRRYSRLRVNLSAAPLALPRAYNLASMGCAELAALRREATTVFKDLSLCRRRARQHAAAMNNDIRVASALVRRGDFEAYLQRRLARSAARIESHLVAHGCQA